MSFFGYQNRIKNQIGKDKTSLVASTEMIQKAIHEDQQLLSARLNTLLGDLDSGVQVKRSDREKLRE